jgi:hypothetical protein
VSLLSVLQLLVTANAPSILILSTLMIETIRCSETAVLEREARRHIPKDDIFLLIILVVMRPRVVPRDLTLQGQYTRLIHITKTNSVALSPRANYTD